MLVIVPSGVRLRVAWHLFFFSFFDLTLLPMSEILRSMAQIYAFWAIVAVYRVSYVLGDWDGLRPRLGVCPRLLEFLDACAITRSIVVSFFFKLLCHGLRHRLQMVEDGHFTMSGCCVTNSNPDLLSCSETVMGQGIRSSG